MHVFRALLMYKNACSVAVFNVCIAWPVHVETHISSIVRIAM